MALPKGLTLDEVLEAAQRDDETGFCLDCGNEQGECEPDARGYKCDDCGKRRVYGAEEIVIMYA